MKVCDKCKEVNCKDTLIVRSSDANVDLCEHCLAEFWLWLKQPPKRKQKDVGNGK